MSYAVMHVNIPPRGISDNPLISPGNLRRPGGVQSAAWTIGSTGSAGSSTPATARWSPMPAAGPTRPRVDDVVAETFTVAWRRLDDIPADSPLPWLYGVARRVVANQRRSADRRRRLVTKLASDRNEPSPTGPSAPNDVVVAALARLRSDDQEILRLAAWELLGASDIALVLGCTPNAAALRLSRARRRLCDEMTGTELGRTSTQRKATDD
jgi:RNA polymerase sigma factor (sigma-70 family)